MCEPKRRWNNREDVGARIGIQAFQRFYKATQPNSTKEKTHEDFIKSPFYAAFVKFGWNCHQIRALNPMALVDYLLDNNVKIDWWTKDRYYEKYIIVYMQKEVPSDAVTPSHILMLRAGMIRRLASGIYEWLPLGLGRLVPITISLLLAER